MSTLQKIVKGFAIALAIAILFGIISIISSIIIGISGINYLFEFIGNEENVQIIENTFDKNEVKNLYLDSDIGDIDIVVGNELKVIAKNVSENFNCTLEGDTLKIVESKEGLSMFKGNDTRITIYIPDDLIFNTVQLDFSVGDNDIQSLKANKLNLNSGTGQIDIRYLEVLESAIITNGVGELDIENSNLNNLELKTGVGECDLRGTIKGDSTVKADIGSINIRLDSFDEATDKIKIEKDIGELEVNERKYSGNQEFGQGDENIINIEGSIGNIDIEY